MIETILAAISAELAKSGYEAIESIFKKHKADLKIVEALLRESRCNRELLAKLLKAKSPLDSQNLIANLETKLFDAIASDDIPLQYIFKGKVKKAEKARCLDMLAKMKCTNRAIEKKIGSIEKENDFVPLLYYKIRMLKKMSETGQAYLPVRYKNILALLMLYIVNHTPERGKRG